MRKLSGTLAPLVFLPTMLLPAAVATADPANTNRSEDVTFTQTNPCNGEVIQLTGKTESVTKRQKDGTFHYLTLQGQGVGSLGNEYVYRFSGKLRDSDRNIVIHDQYQVTSKGSAPNFMQTVFYSMNGVSHGDARCLG